MGYDIEKEKREAIEAGHRALNSLSTAKENLNSAKNWGLVDMFGGGCCRESGSRDSRYYHTGAPTVWR